MEVDDSHVSMISGGIEERKSSKLPQYFAAFAATLMSISAGTTVGWSSPAIAEMRSPNATLHLTPEQSSWTGSLLAIGAFVGALPAGSMVDNIGRKWTIISLSIPITASWVMIYFAKTISVLYTARFLAGLGLGAVCAAVPVYLVEIAEDSVRGFLGSTFQLSLVTGTLYAFIVGALVPYTQLPIYCGSVTILFFVLFLNAPESPIYLLKKDRRKQAEDALHRLRGQKYNIYKELHAMEKELSMHNTDVSLMEEISKRSSLLSLATCLLLMTFQQLSGINVVVFYMESIFHDAGSSLDPAVSTVLAGGAQMISTTLAATLIDRSGRKILLQISSAVMAICLSVLGYYFHLKSSGRDVSEISILPVTAVILFILMYGVGYGPIPWLMSGEILPPEIKGQGLGIASASKWILAFAVTKSFQPLSHAVGPALTYWLFAVICAIGFFFSTFVVIETKGKSLPEIQEEMFGKRTKKKKINTIA